MTKKDVVATLQINNNELRLAQKKMSACSTDAHNSIENCIKMNDGIIKSLVSDEEIE